MFCKKVSGILLFLMTFCLTIISAQKVEEVILDTDIGSMPEGIAIDQNNGNLYISSIRMDKISVCNNDGKNCHDIIKPREEGYTFGTGMMIVKNNLFACARIGREKKPIILQIDLATHEVIHTYRLPDSVNATFNDLTVDQNFNAYMTDSDFNRIYRLDYQTGKISLFLEDVEVKGPNGICISDDQTKLYMSSTTFGIRIVDIKTKKILNPLHVQTVGKGIDGIKYHNNKLYVVYNYGGKEREKQGLEEFPLLNNGTEIGIGKALTIGHPANRIPTTVGIYKGHAYYLANSQFDNYNWAENTVKRPDELVKTVVLKVEIE